MLSLLLLAPLLLAAPLPQDDEQPPPDPELIKQTVKELRRVLALGEPAEKVAAIERASAVVDAKVVEEIAKGLRQDELAVQSAVLRALRFTDHPDALEALERAYKRDAELRESPELYEALVKGIAQHGSPGSVGLLTDFSLKNLTHQVVRARVLGLGMIRDRDAVEGLFAMMAKFGRRQVQPYMGDFRTALVVLVGEDHGGQSQDAWLRWWRESKDELEIAPTVPELPARMRKAWSRYWELPEPKRERPRERGGREGDGKRDRPGPDR